MNGPGVATPAPGTRALVLAVALTAGSIAWLAALGLAVGGRAGGGGLPGDLVYAAASLVCHQQPERSFHAAGHPLPVCARCLGLYLGGALGALLGWAGRPAASGRARRLLTAAALPTAATLALEWSGSSALSNVTRWAAALPLGAAAGWLFVRLLRAEARRAPAL